MDLSDRVGWLLFGMVVGFILGYIVRALREIRAEVDDIDSIVKESQMKDRLRDRDDKGITRFPVVANAALFLVVVITVWAAFASQKASNEAESAQKELARISVCNQEYLAETIMALNERTEYTVEQAEANVKLQRSQSKFLTVLLAIPPAEPSTQRLSLSDYLDTLNEFVDIYSKSANKAENNPYPTNDDFQECLEEVN